MVPTINLATNDLSKQLIAALTTEQRRSKVKKLQHLTLCFHILTIPRCSRLPSIQNPTTFITSNVDD